MKTDEAIEMLRAMQNKVVDYAEMVGAPDFAYGCKYVYPEPEDYAIEEAIEALKEIQQYREIGTVEECREAVEKQKVKYIKIESYCPAYCPTCRFELSESLGDGYYEYFENLSRCPKCGQKICWDEDLEEMEDERD